MLKLKPLLLTILLVVLTLPALAQEASTTLFTEITTPKDAERFVESLDSHFEQDKDKTIALAEQALNQISPDNIKLKAKLLNRLGRRIFLTNPEKTVKFNLRAIELTKGTDYRTELAQSYNDLGIGYYYMGDYPKARTAYQMSLDINRELGDLNRVAGGLNNIALISSDEGDYALAIELYQKAYELYLEVGTELDRADVQLNIAQILFNLERYQEAQSYMFAVLKIYQKLEDMPSIAHATDFIGVLYQRQGGWESAIKLHHEALKIARKENLNYFIGLSNNNLSYTYLQSGNFDKAKEHALVAVEVLRANNYKQALVDSLNSLAMAHLKHNELQPALNFAHQAYEEATQINDKSNIAKSYKLLSDIYLAREDFKQAYEYHNLFKDIDDQVLKGKYEQEVSSRQYAFEQLKHQNELALAEQARQQLDNENREQLTKMASYYQIIISVLVLSGLALILLMYRQKLEVSGFKNRLIEQQRSYQRDSRSLLVQVLQQGTQGQEFSSGASVNPLVTACQDAFDYQSIKRGELFLTMRDISVDRFLSYISDSISVTFSRNQRPVKVAFKPLEGMLRADKQRCQKVVTAITEFFTAFDCNSPIQVSARIYNKRLIISVEDIHTHLSQQVYDQFLDVKQSLPEIMQGFKGSRIAMPLAIELMKKQQARLVVSLDENRGTIASLSFPLI